MPGHVKKSTGLDPDPSPWLKVSDELRSELRAKPYDAKKSCWVPDKVTGGFKEGLIDSNLGDKVTVTILENREKKVFKRDQVHQVNPPKFDCCDDMSNLTYLNDPCVLWNSIVRYKNQLIYTYSGLFCIAINPYKRYPIYTQRAIEIYIGRRRAECPPHIFGVAEGSYQGLMNAGKNQSILITGESGAGKTENTKKVIAYFACVGASGKRKEGEASLEDKIVQTNPVLEAWGNAKTVRNDNSSRFGKFIRIWFNQAGKLSGADMVVYLLEKSRLTYQAELERCYHAFYNIMSDAVPDLKQKCRLSNNIHDYWWVSQGKVTVESIDDKEDMQFADEAYDILGFTQEEKYNIYKLTATVMHMGNMTKDFVPVGKEEQAEVKHEDNAHKIAELCGIDAEWMINYFCKPKLKVGTEWVTKGQTCPQASSSVAGIARKVYELVFRYIVDKCNETLVDPTMKKILYIGCLDIAGFEIFDFNGFEQLCINFCNEKLQQFFNNHMFVLEQEEYIREGIEWTNMDFGMDLQKCIDMFEKPMGLLAILEEESLFPKATDQTFAAKLHENLLAKCDTFAKASPKPDPHAHFAIIHYAANVSYNLAGWLEKNKDPLNDTVVELMKNGSNKMLVECFRDHPGQPAEVKKDTTRGSRKKGGGKTVSAFYKGQLDDLMKTLYATDPSFIRCVVPNTHKQPGMMQPDLIMHQYQCNGVLAGIAICRKGFPNKMIYPDFKARYNILAASLVAKAKNAKMAAKAVLDSVALAPEKYRLGHTKVFFRAGILGFMEELREDRVALVLSWLQATARGKQSRMIFKKMQDQKLALYACQRSIRNYYIGKTWPWWQLWLALKPNLKCSKFAQFKAEYERKIDIATKNIGKALTDRKRVEGRHDLLIQQKDELTLALKSGGTAVKDIVDKTIRVENMASDVAKQLEEVESRIADERQIKNGIQQQQSKVGNHKLQLVEDIKELENKLGSAKQDKIDKDEQIINLKEELQQQGELISKITKEKRAAQDGRLKVEESAQALDDKCNHLSRVKNKLEVSLDEAEDNLEREKKTKSDVEKIKRKAEADLKLTQETLADLERVKAELNQCMLRKEKEWSAMLAKFDDETTLGGKYMKQTKEIQARIEELEEELIVERSSRSKAEKTRGLLKKDLEDLGMRLEEAGANTATQVELNKKREMELERLKNELGERNIGHESTLAAIRMRHNNTMSELGEQIDTLNRNKLKAEQDKAHMERDLNESRQNLEEGVRAKAELDREGKLLQGTITESHQKLDEMARALNDAECQRKRLEAERMDLERQIEEMENGLSGLSKQKTSLTTQLEDMKSLGDAEARDRSSLLVKVKSLTTEFHCYGEKLENEHERKSDSLKALSKATSDIQLWRTRFETEGLARVEELESSKGKLAMRLGEADETVESLSSKIVSGEKAIMRMQTDLEEITGDYERTHASAIINEKRGRNFDKVVSEWVARADDLNAEIEASNKEGRNYNSELFRLRAAHDEATEQLDVVKRENKNLADEIRDLLDQLGEGGRSIHELDKQRRYLEVEKSELQGALEEAEAALEQEENKVLRSQLELGQIKQEIDRRIHEKEEEFDNTRKNHERAMDSLAASLEAEQRAKTEACRIKKKLESDINDLEIGLDQANKANVEGQKAVQRYQGHLRTTIQGYEEESRLRQEIQEALGMSERRGNALHGEVEESTCLLHTTERARRQVEAELEENRAAINEMSAINSKAMAEKRAHESTIHALQAEIDDTVRAAKNGEEKAKKAMIDAARLADELRAEQEHSNSEEKHQRALESQLTELETRLADAESNAAKLGRAAMSKLEMRIRELEMTLGSVQSQTSESAKAYQRAERRVKELEFQREEDQKNQERMSELAQKLQQKIRTYKQQIEDAEEIAALNLAKFRKAQQEFEENEDRAKSAELAMSCSNGFRAGSIF
eukprot:maker-scaffold14_size734282-snap-gene-6.29 protein:Tk11311 transcript:maker-scaffold14_size734282-snap-gene-6.29-mRNA-1 annotation:"myosin heavy muscle isoform x29"